MVKSLDYKGWSRANVKTLDDATKAKAILREMDDFEFGYMPNDWFGIGNSYHLVPTGKFDPDLDRFRKACAEAGIDIFFRSATDAQYIGDGGWVDNGEFAKTNITIGKPLIGSKRSK